MLVKTGIVLVFVLGTLTPGRGQTAVAPNSGALVPSLQSIDFGAFSHSDHETVEMVPWTALEGTTRAYAKILTDVNHIDTKDLQPEMESRSATITSSANRRS